MYKHFFKRVFDFIISLIALLLIGWVLIIIAIWLHYANNKSSLTPRSAEGRLQGKNPSPQGEGNWIQRWLQPVIFTQERPGKDGKIFKVVKFKTMTDERDAEGNLLPDEQRLTKVGKFVRSTSIDELPQLINVLKGDMALIGPRPLLVQYLPLYSQEQARRHEVRPGISGWAQCHGRNTISWAEKFKLDVWYVDHVSLWTDLKVIGITIKNVLMRKDINSATAATMEAFNGNN
jgi:lipopolysaccharide/colanic/teichoic acid biosynthesis glycosyltransferase